MLTMDSCLRKNEEFVDLVFEAIIIPDLPQQSQESTFFFRTSLDSCLRRNENPFLVGISFLKMR